MKEIKHGMVFGGFLGWLSYEIYYLSKIGAAEFFSSRELFFGLLSLGLTFFIVFLIVEFCEWVVK